MAKTTEDSLKVETPSNVRETPQSLRDNVSKLMRGEKVNIKDMSAEEIATLEKEYGFKIKKQKQLDNIADRKALELRLKQGEQKLDEEVFGNDENTGLINDNSGDIIEENEAFFSVKKNKDNQDSVMWTLGDGVLNNREVAAFYKKVSERHNGNYKNYRKADNGEFIYEIENKLIYSDDDFYNPTISKVVTFNTENDTELYDVKEFYYDTLEATESEDTTGEIIRNVFGQETISISNIGDSEAFKGNTKGTKRSERTNNKTIDGRSREDVKTSLIKGENLTPKSTNIESSPAGKTSGEADKKKVENIAKVLNREVEWYNDETALDDMERNSNGVFIPGDVGRKPKIRINENAE